MGKLIEKCPSCGTDMSIKTLVCKNCGIEINCDFNIPKGNSLNLNEDEIDFLKVFMKYEGNINNMCKYVNDSELKGKGGPKDTFQNWITAVHQILRKQHIRFECELIGSGSRNMVVRNCNEGGYFDLDFQIILTKYPVNMKPKEIKDIFRKAFNISKPKDFKDMRDRTQSLRTKSLDREYGYDVIITRIDEDDSFFILYNDKDDNSANNFDYSWKPRKEMNKYRERFNRVKSNPEMYEYLRKKYLQKRHAYKDDTSPSKKKSYQILNEAVVETLKDFGYRI